MSVTPWGFKDSWSIFLTFDSLLEQDTVAIAAPAHSANSAKAKMRFRNLPLVISTVLP